MKLPHALLLALASTRLQALAFADGKDSELLKIGRKRAPLQEIVRLTVCCKEEV